MSSENQITSRRIALEHRYKLLVESIKDYAIFMLTPEGIVDSWNPGAQHFKGYTAEEIIGQSFSRFYTEEDRAAGLPARVLHLAATTGRFESEGWRVRKDGSRFWAHVIIDSVKDEHGNLVGFAKITRDITEKHQAELELEIAKQALQRAQRLESIGKLTGGVAHDFNNILQVIGGNLQLLKSHVADNNLAAKRLETAIDAVERGGKLSAQLLAFARRQPLQPVVVGPTKIIRGVGDMLKRVLGETISVENVIAAGIWNISVDVGRLENVLINLAINARDAMPEGGKLTIEVNNSMLDDDYASKHQEVTPGQYVAFAVTDTGSGMPTEILEKACEPFFTTKREGEGTGLGLSMAFGFVKQSGGHFKIYSEVGQGTTVRMYFPRALENEAQAVTHLAGPIAGGTETILVVEDDLAVQATAIDMLTSLGYRVLKADDAASALGIIKSGIGIDLLFTDVVMPGELRSPELARQAKILIPGIEVLFTSGYTQNAIVHGGRLDPGVHLISKPYRREQLARKIRHLLAGRQQSEPGGTPEAEEEKAAADQSRRILVVEDNDDALFMTCELLGQLGHEVRGTGTAEEAAQLFDSEQFDILFTDFRLPGMNGVDLAKQLKQKKPDLRIIVASGYGNAIASDNELGAVLITKPYDLSKLEEVLKQDK